MELEVQSVAETGGVARILRVANTRAALHADRSVEAILAHRPINELELGAVRPRDLKQAHLKVGINGAANRGRRTYASPPLYIEDLAARAWIGRYRGEYTFTCGPVCAQVVPVGEH